MALPIRQFGPQFKVPAIGFGGGAISGEGGGYGFGEIDEAAACKVLEHAFERGIRLFDTAPIYGFGMSEKRIGLALSRHKKVRSEITLISKLGVAWGEDKKVFISNAPDVAWRMLETSLKDLQTDFLDVYMIHWPDAKVPVEETMQALAEMKKQGLIKAIGVSNFDRTLLERARKIAAIDALQCNFSVFDNEPRDEHFENLEANGIGFMSYGTLAKGLLAGTVKRDRAFDAKDYRATFPAFTKLREALDPFIEEFAIIAKEVGATPAQLAVSWVLSHKATSVALCGSKRVEQIDEVVNGASLELAPSIRGRIDALSRRATPVFRAHT